MAKYRQLYTEFWNDNFVLNLEPEEKYFYIYLLTNANTSQCGIYELPKKIIEMQTGYNRETVDSLLKKFQQYKKIIYSEETNEIIILNWVKYNEPNNINAIKCVNKEIKKIKNRNFVKELYLQYSKIGLRVDKLFNDMKNSSISVDKNNEFKNYFVDINKNDEFEDSFITEDINNNKDENRFSVIDKNDETENRFIDISKNDETENGFIDISKNNETKDSFEELTRGYEGAYKGLVSKEVISNKQKVINNKQEVISNSCCSNKQEESKYINITENNNCEFEKQDMFQLEKYNNILENNNFKENTDTTTTTQDKTTATTDDSNAVAFCRANFKNINRILAIFESNIHKVVPMEYEKIIEWSNNFSYDVIIMAIEEAIGNNIKNIRYIEKILNSWLSKGLTSTEDIESYRKKWVEKKNKVNSKENSVDPWNYDGQRDYDFQDLEKKLLGWQIA